MVKVKWSKLVASRKGDVDMKLARDYRAAMVSP